MRFRLHIYFTLLSIIGFMITFQHIRSNADVPTPVSKKVKVAEGELRCTLQGLYRSQGKILGVFRIENEGDKMLYLRPYYQSIDGGFNFTDACLLHKNERYQNIKNLSCLKLNPYIFLSPKRPRLGLQSSLIFNLWFEGPPSTISIVDIILPGVDTFKNIPIQVSEVRLRVSTVVPNIDCILEKVENTPDSLDLTITLMETEGTFGFWGPNEQSDLWNLHDEHEAILFDPGFSEIVSGPDKYPNEIWEGIIDRGWRKKRSHPLPPFSFIFPPVKNNVFHYDLTGNKMVKFLIKFPNIELEEKTFTLFVPNCEPFIDIPLPTLTGKND